MYVRYILTNNSLCFIIDTYRRQNGNPKQNLYTESEKKDTSNRRSSKAATLSVYTEIIKEGNT